MWVARIVSIASASVLLAVVSGVPAFAQSNTRTPANVTVGLTAMNVLREYVGDRVSGAGEIGIPPNVQAPWFYRPLIQTMLDRSPTFRQQCARIAAASDVVVTIERNDAGASAVRARTQMGKARDGTLRAAIQIVGREDFFELIAHEFEHIVEQLDGIDLSSRAKVPDSGVSRGVAEADAFETVRAKRIGLMVAAEVRRSDN
jgi:hypothetical protein